ncbi:hypothetical protein FQR65_LT10218 [Abscondita terminalis]|nr:hypothetical protein FQR65_LT10218 [Abscondita terminalis]
MFVTILHKIQQYTHTLSNCPTNEWRKKIKKIEDTDEIGRIIHKDFLDPFCENYVLFGEEETSLGDNYLKFVEEIENFEVRDTDVIVASYPKAGTTWTQEMVWLVGNDLDFEGAKEHLDKRFPHFELCTVVDFQKMKDKLGATRPDFVSDSINFIKNLPEVRYIKTHLPYCLLPKQILNGTRKPKIIYVMRDPKDVCVSYYHHGRLIQGWRPNFQDFSKVFLSEKIMFGSFWKHVLGFWERRQFDNVLVITYEEMKADLLSVVKKVAKFLNKNLPEEKIPQLLNHLSFESMKKNRAVNQQDKIESRMKHNLVSKKGTFMRTGQTQKYKDEMSKELIDQFNNWTKLYIEGTSFQKETIATMYLKSGT